MARDQQKPKQCPRHTWNQSIVQQFTSDGFCRNRSLKAPPMGEKHSTTCRYALQRVTKKPHSSAGLSNPFLAAAGRTASMTW